MDAKKFSITIPKSAIEITNSIQDQISSIGRRDQAIQVLENKIANFCEFLIQEDMVEEFYAYQESLDNNEPNEQIVD